MRKMRFLQRKKSLVRKDDNKTKQLQNQQFSKQLSFQNKGNLDSETSRHNDNGDDDNRIGGTPLWGQDRSTSSGYVPSPTASPKIVDKYHGPIDVDEISIESEIVETLALKNTPHQHRSRDNSYEAQSMQYGASPSHRSLPSSQESQEMRQPTIHERNARKTTGSVKTLETTTSASRNGSAVSVRSLGKRNPKPPKVNRSLTIDYILEGTALLRYGIGSKKRKQQLRGKVNSAYSKIEVDEKAEEKWKSTIIMSRLASRSLKKINVFQDATNLETANTTSTASSNSVSDSDIDDDDNEDEQIAVETASIFTLMRKPLTSSDRYHEESPATHSTALLPVGNDADPHAWMWNYSQFCLSVLEHRNKQCTGQPVMLSENGIWLSSLFTSNEERMVKESIRHYIRLHLSTDPIEMNRTDSVPVDVDSYYTKPKKTKKNKILSRISEAHQQKQQNDDEDETRQSEGLALELLQVNNFENAIAVMRIVLDKQEKVFQDVSRYHSSSSPRYLKTEEAVMNTLRKLTMLCLAAGPSRQKEASRYNTELTKRLEKYENDNGSKNKYVQAIVDCKMEQGLVQCNNNRVGKALKCWREAMHIVIGITGYPRNHQESHATSHLAVLFNNVGVLHLTSGALQDSIRTLEESIELQRIIIRSQNSQGTSNNSFPVQSFNIKSNQNSVNQFNLAHALFQLAVSMSNLAVVYERDYQYDKAISLLDEALSILESILADTSKMEELMRQCQQRLVKDQRKMLFEKNGRYNETDGNTFDDDASVDSARSSLLFGNTDGMPENQNRRRRAFATKLAMDVTDQHDFLLLGPLKHELSTEHRVRETVYVWFGRRIVERFDEEYESDADESLLQDEVLPSKKRNAFEGDMTVYTAGESTITGDAESSICRSKEVIPVDLDGSDVVNAELHLNAIYRQAMNHLDHNEINDALELFRSALRNHREKYGDIHHLVGTALHNIGMVHLFARQYGDALIVFQEAVNVRVAALGVDHPDVQVSMMKIALIHMGIGNLSGARASFWEIRDKSIEILGHNHPNLVKVMNNIGVVAYECGDIVNSLRSLEIAYEYQHRFYEDLLKSEDEVPSANPRTVEELLPTMTKGTGKSCELAAIATANTLCNMGFVYGKDGGEKVEALKMYEQALEILKKHVPVDDDRITEVQQNIDYLIGTSLDAFEHDYERQLDQDKQEPLWKRCHDESAVACQPSTSDLINDPQRFCRFEGGGFDVPDEISTFDTSCYGSSATSRSIKERYMFGQSTFLESATSCLGDTNPLCMFSNFFTKK